jgi:hypothetical protein
MDAEALTNARTILDTAKPDDLVVVAALGTDGAAGIVTLNPNARRLVNLASSLLDSAADMLAEGGEESDARLYSDVADALDILPDRFADVEG